MKATDPANAPTQEVDVFIVNTSTGEVHHKNFATVNCQLAEIHNPQVVESSLAEVRRQGFDLCGWCFKSRA